VINSRGDHARVRAGKVNVRILISKGSAYGATSRETWPSVRRNRVRRVVRECPRGLCTPGQRIERSRRDATRAWEKMVEKKRSVREASAGDESSQETAAQYMGNVGGTRALARHAGPTAKHAGTRAQCARPSRMAQHSLIVATAGGFLKSGFLPSAGTPSRIFSIFLRENRHYGADTTRLRCSTLLGRLNLSPAIALSRNIGQRNGPLVASDRQNQYASTHSRRPKFPRSPSGITGPSL